MEDHPAEAGVGGGLQIGIGLDQGLGIAAGFFDDGRVALQVGNSLASQVVLFGAEQVAGAAEPLVVLVKASSRCTDSSVCGVAAGGWGKGVLAEPQMDCPRLERISPAEV